MKIRDLLCCALTVGVVTTAGCGKKDDKGAAGKGSAAGSAGAGSAAGTAAGSAGETEAPLPPEVQVDKAAVQAVIDAWLAAQNGGDFAAYQAVYADKMEGVKRVGARTWRFDRKGWLADRERMFKNKMTVAAKDVAITGSALAPVVELTQSFQQGKFADEGTKRLVLVKTDGGLRIAREEMLRSVVAGAMAGAAKGQLWLPMKLEGKTYAVLDDAANDAWGSGKLRGPFESVFTYALRDATKAPSAASWATRDLIVYDASGKKCAAKVGALQLIGGGTPHFGEVQIWDGDNGEGPVWSKAERARAIYDMSGPKLIGELAIDGGCEPIVVLDAASPAKVFGQVAADPAGDAKAIAAFRKLPAYGAIQGDFRDNYDGKGAWAEPSVATYSDGTRRIVVVSAKDGDGCGSFYGALTAVFEDVGGKLTQLSASDQGYVDVTAVVDVDGDGVVELIADPDDYSSVTALYQGGPSGFAVARSIEFPFNDCGC